MFLQKEAYIPLADVDVEAETLPRDENHTRNVILTASILLNILLVSIFTVYPMSPLWSTNGASTSPYNNNLNTDLKKTSSFSPLLDKIDLKPSMKVMNGLHVDNETIYRQPPSPEVDTAWEAISMIGYEGYIASSEDITKSGKDPSLAIQAPPSLGKGPDAYIVEIDVFHQIHCLDMLRKHIHYSHYFSKPITPAQESHRDHCIYTLLQNLMCKADVGIVTLNWMYSDKAGRPIPKEDFNVVKKCVDFEALLEWSRENAIGDFHRVWSELEYPEGAKTVPVDLY